VCISGEISVLKKDKKLLKKNAEILEKRLAAALRTVEKLRNKMKTTRKASSTIQYKYLLFTQSSHIYCNDTVLEKTRRK